MTINQYVKNKVVRIALKEIMTTFVLSYYDK